MLSYDMHACEGLTWVMSKPPYLHISIYIYIYMYLTISELPNIASFTDLTSTYKYLIYL